MLRELAPRLGTARTGKTLKPRVFLMGHARHEPGGEPGRPQRREVLRADEGPL
jgi:hypothetical protein